MNIISTNCAGSYLMTENNHSLGNPFSWAFVPYASIEYLINNFENIKWNKILIKDNPSVKGTFILEIDKKIDIKYIHYHYNPENIKIKIINHDISFINIKNFIIDRYKIRLDRMIKSKEDPKFLILENNSCGSPDEFLKLYEKFKNFNKYDICWGIYKTHNIDLTPNSIFIDEKELPIQIIYKYKNTIKKILKISNRQ